MSKNTVIKQTEAESLMRDVMLRRPVSMQQAERGLAEIQLMRCELSFLRATLARAEQLINELQDANIRQGRQLVAAHEYIGNMSGETLDNLRRALDEVKNDE